ncbi:hypothetical protein FPRO06_04644 [Fusarium proliferatum]|nr:hypothetical protein FPRO06_04644 [Fusarium proliferatum]
MRVNTVINVVLAIVAFIVQMGTPEVTPFVTRRSTLIDPQSETVTDYKAMGSGLPKVPADTAFAALGRSRDDVVAGSHQTSDVANAAKSQTLESPSASTSLKWNEAGKWGVLGIASAIIIAVAGSIIRSLYRKYFNVAGGQRDDTHHHRQNVANHGQIAPAQDAAVIAARQSWIDQARLPPDADAVGSLPTDQEMQIMSQYPDAPQVPLQDFGDDFASNEWLPRMPQAHLPTGRSATAGI